MARFLAGKIQRQGLGSWWFVEGVSDEDKSHPFARQELYNGNLSFDGLLKLAWDCYDIHPSQIKYRS